ncbi:MAG TPA: SDR family oxidoreductase [Alphaproteobacteria bacterium]|nr:SDR family oxidoreductase [Alphaproteobacteria bacterium]
MSEIRMDGKVVLVTGGTQGVGEAIAREAAASGVKGLCITGRDPARGNRVAKELEALGCPTLFVAGDLADAAACRTIAAKAWERFGVVDGLVNAAGLTDRGTIENTSVELWDRLFDVNARAPFILMQEAVRRLQAAKRAGSIVNIITRSSHGGQPFLTAYSSSKGALAILTKNVAHAVRHHRIRVNGLNIGWTETPGEHAIQKRDGKPADWLERAEPNQPFGRLIKPKDVAVATVYLLSDASEMMTGALIDFDQNVMGAYD